MQDGAAGAAAQDNQPEDAQALAALRRFAKSRANAERCELCGTELGADHQHLLDRASRQITCSCDACAILFCGQQSAKFLRVPRRVLKLDHFAWSDSEWDALALPINLAFFVRQPNGEASVMYPSAAGVMVSMIELPPWAELFAAHPEMLAVEAEVEALLINRIGDQDLAYLVPIDAAYRLVGVIRTKWRGLSGGVEVWQAIADFFAGLERQASPLREAAHA
jgi:hypothetical protein